MKSLIIDGAVRELTDEEAEKIKEILKPKRKWGFEGQNFVILHGDGGVKKAFTGLKDYIDRCNAFSTKEEAEHEDQKRLALGRIRKYVVENDVKMAGFGWEPDWSDDSWKYQIEGWNYRAGKVVWDYWTVDTSSFGLIFPTEEACQRVLDNCEKDLEILLKR